MHDTLDKVLDIAKKLRKFAKKGASPEMQNLITDLNLHLADLKVEQVQQQAGRTPEPAQAHASQTSRHKEQPEPVGAAPSQPDRRGPEDDFNFTLS